MVYKKLLEQRLRAVEDSISSSEPQTFDDVLNALGMEWVRFVDQTSEQTFKSSTKEFIELKGLKVSDEFINKLWLRCEEAGERLNKHFKGGLD